MLEAEWWTSDDEAFDGGRILDDCAAGESAPLALSFGRILVLQLAAGAVRRHCRGEDMAGELMQARAYLNELDLPPAALRQCAGILDAVDPFDARVLAERLLSVCAAALDSDLEGTARSYGELAYETARLFALDDVAHGAACALARAARLAECPAHAQHWRSIAGAHRRRVVGERFGCGGADVVARP